MRSCTSKGIEIFRTSGRESDVLISVTMLADIVESKMDARRQESDVVDELSEGRQGLKCMNFGHTQVVYIIIPRYTPPDWSKAIVPHYPRLPV
jgi:hypothetical protein